MRRQRSETDTKDPSRQADQCGWSLLYESRRQNAAQVRQTIYTVFANTFLHYKIGSIKAMVHTNVANTPTLRTYKTGTVGEAQRPQPHQRVNGPTH